MFNLIYIIIGIYFLKVIILKINQYYKSTKNLESKASELQSNKERRKFSLKKFLKTHRRDKNNIFIFNYQKEEKNEDVKRDDSNTILKEDRQLALEKAKYKCECCGNIANLNVYSDNDNFTVLCRKCYEERSSNINLNYE